MAIDCLDLTCAGGTGTPHRRIHLISIECAGLFVKGFACRKLVPGLDARNTFHVTEDNDTHTALLLPGSSCQNPVLGTKFIFYNLASPGRVLGFLVLSFITSVSYSR